MNYGPSVLPMSYTDVLIIIIMIVHQYYLTQELLSLSLKLNSYSITFGHFCQVPVEKQFFLLTTSNGSTFYTLLNSTSLLLFYTLLFRLCKSKLSLTQTKALHFIYFYDMPFTDIYHFERFSIPGKGSGS